MEVRERLIKIIKEVGDLKCDDKIISQSHDLGSLGLNSLELIQMVVAFEDEFDIILGDEFLQIDVINDFQNLEDAIKGMIES